MGYYINLDEKLFWYKFLPFFYVYIFPHFVALITVFHKHNISLSPNMYVKSGEWSICSIISKISKKTACLFSCLRMILICFVLFRVVGVTTEGFFSSGFETLVHTVAKRYKWYFEKMRKENHSPYSSCWVVENENLYDRPMDECIFDDRMRMIDGIVHIIFSFAVSTLMHLLLLL